MMAFALLTFGTISLVASQDAPPVSVNLTRTWEKGEKQAYTLEVSSEAFEGSSITGQVSFTVEVKETLENGEARVTRSYQSIKVTIGGEEVEGFFDIPDDIVAVYGKNGLPKKLALDSPDDPIAMVLPTFFVPSKEVKIGEDFSFTWSSEDGELDLKGTGKLVATGRLYEEHVAMVKYQMDITGKELPDGKFEFTSYVNSKTGKLVKAEGTFSAEEMKGKFVIKKVRNV